MVTKAQNYLNYFGEQVTWEKGTDPRFPYVADFHGEKCVIRINDFPDEHLYTLIVDGVEIAEFDDWPGRGAPELPDEERAAHKDDAGGPVTTPHASDGGIRTASAYNTPSASYSLTLRVKLSARAGTLGELTVAIGHAGGDIGAIDIVSVGLDTIIRDLTVNAASADHGKSIVEAARAVEGVEVINVSDRVFLMHLD